MVVGGYSSRRTVDADPCWCGSCWCGHQQGGKFEPVSYYTGETISLIAFIVLVLALAFAIYREIRKPEPDLKKVKV